MSSPERAGRTAPNRSLVHSVVVGPQAPSATSPLGPDEIRVVAFDLDAESVSEHEPLLSRDERVRAHRFKTAQLRNRFVVRRGRLRQLLGELTGTAPSEVALGVGEHGKPTLRLPGEGAVEFNLSHSGPIALVAVSLGRPVGVDVERLRPFPEVASVVDRFFTPTERADFAQLPEAEQLPAFFGVWTRKEAFAKATGLGVASTLSEVTVSTGDVPDPQILSIGDLGLPKAPSSVVSPDSASADTPERRRLDPSAWRLCDVPTKSELAAAVVGASGDWHLTTVRWS